MGDKPTTRPLPTHRTTQTETKCTQTSMPRAGFELTILMFGRVKPVYASDLAHNVIGTVAIKAFQKLSRVKVERKIPTFRRTGPSMTSILLMRPDRVSETTVIGSTLILPFALATVWCICVYTWKA
jgi:hypothetical protein